MKYFNLAVCDTDKEYLNAITAYINSANNTPLTARGFTSRDNLLEYLSKKETDIVLISQTEYSPEILNHNIKLLIILSNGVIDDNLKEYKTIYKYQSVDNIMKEICNYYADSTQETIHNRDKTNLITVYSPIGRSGKTSLSLSMAKQLSNKYNTLYVNLEPFTSLTSYIIQENTYNLSDIIYYSKQKHPNLNLKIQSIKNTWDRLDYIAPAICYNDLLDTTEEDWEYLLTQLRSQGGYQYIILDLGNVLPICNYILKNSDNIYITILPNKTALTQLEQWENSINLTNQKAILNKSQYVLNTTTKASIYNINKEYTSIPYDELLKNNTSLEQLVGGQFGEHVRGLLLSNIS